jgi:hypothetical protein
MKPSLYNKLASFQSDWLSAKDVTQVPGSYKLTCDVLQPMGGEESYQLHLYHNLRDYLKVDQVKVFSLNSLDPKIIIFEITQ